MMVVVKEAIYGVAGTGGVVGLVGTTVDGLSLG